MIPARLVVGLLGLVLLGGCGKTAPPRVGYAEVQAIFRAHMIRRDDPLWDLPYSEFIDFEFPASWDEPQDKIRLLEVGDAAASNLIKALTDGVGIRVVTASGKLVTKNVQHMPKGRKMPVEDVAHIAAWIDAGCPER